MTSNNIQHKYLKYFLIATGGIISVTFPLFMHVYHTYLLTEVLIYTIFALSLNLLMGYTGLASLGHAAFWGMGGYTVALLMAKVGIDNFFLCTGAALFKTRVIRVVLSKQAITP